MMIKRVAQLIRTAGEIRRKIWASLPFQDRFAEVMCRLASQGTDAFGTAMYSIFLENGIEALPPINGKPAHEWLEQHSVRQLPEVYGRAFGRKAYYSLMRRHQNPATVEDLMSAFVVKFMQEAGEHLKPGTTVAEAESYVLRSLINAGLNMLKKYRREVSETSLERDDIEGPSFLDRAPTRGYSPATVHNREVITRLLASSAIRNKLRRIHPSAEQYLQLSFNDYTDVEIFGNKETPSMLEHPFNANGGRLNPQAWNKYRKAILEVLKSGLQDATAV